MIVGEATAKEMVRDLDRDKRERVCQMLNVKKVPKKDFRSLAAKMKFEKHEIETFERSENPTDVLLRDWERRMESTVDNLIKFLKKMGRDDVIKVVKET